MKWYFPYFLITILLLPTPGFSQAVQQVEYLVEDYSLLPLPPGKSLILSLPSNFLEPEKEYIDRVLLSLGNSFSVFENGNLKPGLTEGNLPHSKKKGYGIGVHYVNENSGRYGGIKFLTPFGDLVTGVMEATHSPYLSIEFFPQSHMGLFYGEDSLRAGGIIPWKYFWDSGNLEILFQLDKSRTQLDYSSEMKASFYPWYPWQGHVSALMSQEIQGFGLKGSWNMANLVVGTGLGLWSEKTNGFLLYPEVSLQFNPGFLVFSTQWGVNSGAMVKEPLIWTPGLFPWTTFPQFVPRGTTSLSWEGEFLKLTGEIQSSSDNFNRLPFEHLYGKVFVSSRYGELGAFSKLEGPPGFFVSALFPLVPWVHAVGIKVKYSPWEELLRTEGELQSSWGKFLINTDQSSFGISWSMEW